MITTYINENRCFTFLEQLGESAPFGSQCLLTRRGPKYKMRQAVRNRNASFSLYQLKAEKKRRVPCELRQHCHHVQYGAHGSGNLVFVRKSTVRVTIDSPSHPVLPDGLRESSGSKPANEIYREESEVYYQPFQTMFQATIGGQKRLLFFFLFWSKTRSFLSEKERKLACFQCEEERDFFLG